MHVYLLTVTQRLPGVLQPEGAVAHQSAHSTELRARCHLDAWCRAKWRQQNGTVRPIHTVPGISAADFFDFWEGDFDYTIIHLEVDGTPVPSPDTA